MNFFDITELYIPNVLINYETIDINTQNKSVIVSNKNEKVKVWTFDNDIYITVYEGSKHFSVQFENKSKNIIKLDDILRVTNSFKELHKDENLKILNAVVGMLIENNDEQLYFSCDNQNKQMYSNLKKYQRLEENINFKKMNNVLSCFYSFDEDKRFLNNLIHTPLNINDMSNHNKIHFISFYETYKNDHKIV